MKHRLVGGVVLVGLAVILWPVVFDTTVVREISQTSQIPPAPAFERFDVSEPQRPDIGAQPDYEVRRQAQVDTPAVDADPVGRDDSTLLPESVANQTLPGADVAKRDENGLPILWAVQLGVFANADNARELRDRAREAGFKVLLQRTESPAGVVFRVFADPKLERGAAEQLKLTIDTRLGVDGYVTRYYP